LKRITISEQERISEVSREHQKETPKNPLKTTTKINIYYDKSSETTEIYQRNWRRQTDKKERKRNPWTSKSIRFTKR